MVLTVVMHYKLEQVDMPRVVISLATAIDLTLSHQRGLNILTQTPLIMLHASTVPMVHIMEQNGQSSPSHLQSWRYCATNDWMDLRNNTRDDVCRVGQPPNLGWELNHIPIHSIISWLHLHPWCSCTCRPPLWDSSVPYFWLLHNKKYRHWEE